MTKPTAHQAYEAKSAAVAARLETLQALLAMHAQREAGNPRNYGYAGDMAHIDTLLAQAVEALTPTTA